MAAVKLPDGKELAVEPGEKARDVAAKIGPRLLRDAVVAKLNGELIDLDAPLDGGGDFEVVTKDSPDGLYVLRHSTAHAMAQAVTELYPGDRKSTRLNSSHANISYAVFCLKKKKKHISTTMPEEYP